MTDGTSPADTTALISAIVTLITAILAVPPLVLNIVRLLRRKRSQSELELLRQVATASVQAIEQLNLHTGKSSDDKLGDALELASTQLAAYGVKVTQQQLRAAIEAAVLLMNAGLQLPAPPADPGAPDEPVPVP